MELARVYTEMSPTKSCYTMENIQKYLEIIQEENEDLKEENFQLKKSWMDEG